MVNVMGAEEETTKTTRDPLKIGIAYVFCHKNNTLVTITDATGAITIARATGGMLSLIHI
mgnify:CR=1 FL=1